MTDLRQLYPCGRIARRRFLFGMANGFLGSAIGGLWAADGRMPEAMLTGARYCACQQVGTVR